MSRHKLKNELVKSSWTMAANIKDVVSRNVVRAATNKDVAIPRDQLNRLVNLIQASVDEAFEGSLKNYQKEVDKHLLAIFPDDTKKK